MARRIRLLINPEKEYELQWMKDVSGVHDTVELLDNAMALLKWALQERRENRQIASIDEDLKSVNPESVIKIVVMSALDAAAKNTNTGSGH